MRYSQHKKFPEARLNLRLLWEYDVAEIDFDAMRDVIIKRVVERGWPQDWYFILNRYGRKSVKEVICNISRLSEKDMQFVMREFSIPREQLKSYRDNRSGETRNVP